MKLSYLIGLGLLALSFVLSVLNLISGIQLSQTTSAPADGHFLRALISLGTAVAGQITLLVSSQNWIEELVSHLQKSEEKVQSWRLMRQSVLPWVFGHFVVVLTAIITGTVSYAGSFPLVHGIIGIALIGVALTALVIWIRFAIQLTNR